MKARTTKTTNRTTSKAKRSIATMLAATMVMTTAANIGASATTAQQVVSINTSTAICPAANASVIGSVVGVVGANTAAKILTSSAAKKILVNVLGAAGEAAGRAVLNKGAEYFLNWALTDKEDENKPKIEDVLERLDGIEDKLDSYHNEQMARMKMIGTKVDSSSFRTQVDVISSDAKAVIETIKTYKDNITTKDSGVIDTTTYKTYKTILSRNACNISTLKKHLSDMEDFVMGKRYATDKQEGFALYSKYMVDLVNDRKIDYNYDKSPDFNEVQSVANAELESMEAACVLDTLCLLTLNNMEYKIREYDIAKGLYKVEDNEKPYSSYENDAICVSKYLKNINDKYQQTVKDNKAIVGAEVTIDGKSKGFNTLFEAWAAVNLKGAKNFTIKLGKDVTSDDVNGLNFKKLDNGKYGFNGQGGLKIMKGKNVTVDMNGCKIFTAHVDNGPGKGRELSVFEMDGNLTLKNGMIEGGKNAVRVNGAQNLTLDNMKIYRTQGSSIDCVGKNENIKMTNCTIKYAQIGNERSALDFGTSAPYKGGALWTGWGGGRYEIKNCTFEKNTNSFGGALELPAFYGSALVEGCKFIGNMSQGYGGAICGGAHILTLKDCKFEDNLAACNGNGKITTLNIGGPYKEINCSFSGNKYVPNLPKIDYEQELKRESDPIKLDMRKIMNNFKPFGINNIFIS